MPTGPTQKVKAEMPAPGIQVDCRLSRASSGGFGLQMKQLDQLTVVGYTPMPDGSNPPAAAQVAIGCVLLGVNGRRVKRMAELKRGSTRARTQAKSNDGRLRHVSGCRWRHASGRQ